MLTEAQLRSIMPNLPAAKALLMLPHLNGAMDAYAVNTLLRTAAFVAQLAHESGEFRWMEEIWGPTAAQRRYEPPSELAARLGNTQTGDGKRFKGRGPIQITGRFNYRKFGNLLGIDLVAEPERAATPEVAFAVAGLYWKSRGLNELADRPDFKEITRRINGGFNGLAERQKYFDRARAVLGEGFVAAPATRGFTRAAPTLPIEPLERGAEAIRDAGPVRAPRRVAAEKVAAAKGPAKTMAPRKAGAKKTAPRKTASRKAPVRKRPSA